MVGNKEYSFGGVLRKEHSSSDEETQMRRILDLRVSEDGRNMRRLRGIFLLSRAFRTSEESISRTGNEEGSGPAGKEI